MADPVVKSPPSRPAKRRSVPSAPVPARRRRRWFSLEKRRVREMVSSEKIISFLKTMVWVVPLTALIWIYAAREQIVSEQGVRIPITVRIGDPARVVELRAPAEGAGLRAELEGPRSNLDRLRREIAQELALEINPAIHSPGREHELSAAEQLNNHPLLLRYGVTARNVEPPTLTVFVDSIEERAVPVHAPPEIANLDGLPVFEPATVTVRGPQHLLEEAAEAGELLVYANLARLDILREPGEHSLSDVPLMRIGRLRQHRHVTVTPSRVRADLRVRQPDIEWTQPRMPVFVEGPPSVLNTHAVTVVPDEVLRNVRLVGPPDQINQIDSGLLPVPVAVLEITVEDEARLDTEQIRTVRYSGLPEGVRVQEEMDRQVRFTISRIRGD